jgi:hypothetical protein
LGLIAASSIVISFNKDAEGLIKKISQFQGYIGVLALVWGVLGVIWHVLNFTLMANYFFDWLTLTAITGLELILGFIFGFGLIAQWTTKGNEEVEAKANDLLNKLSPWKTTLGILALGVGVWTILYDLIFRSVFYALS